MDTLNDEVQERQRRNENLPIGMAATNTANRSDKPIATKDLPGPPYACPECGEEFEDKRPLGQHRSLVHHYRSPSAIYSHDLYLRNKAKREALGLPAKSNKEIRAEREAKQQEKPTHERNHSNDENQLQLQHHIAFAAGYITAFIETYAKGNGLPWNVFARGVAEQLRAASR